MYYHNLAFRCNRKKHPFFHSYVLCDRQALYDTSTPPASSSPATHTEMTEQSTGLETGSSQSQQRSSNDGDIRQDENIAQLDAPESNVTSR